MTFNTGDAEKTNEKPPKGWKPNPNWIDASEVVYCGVVDRKTGEFKQSHSLTYAEAKKFWDVTD